jgi:hypothetical protein
MRTVFFGLLAVILLFLRLMAYAAGFISASVQRSVGRVAAQVAGRWFVAGTGWGGDDVVLNVVEGSSRLQHYISDEARRQRNRGAGDSHVQFLYRIALAGNEPNQP